MASKVKNQINICQLFEITAEKFQFKPAVFFKNQFLTYTELNQKSNQLAHYLRKHGVKNNTLVGICVNRSFEMIIGILAILKAGGAYLPISPNQPAKLIKHILEDSKIKSLLIQNHLHNKLKTAFSTNIPLPQQIIFEEHASKISEESIENLLNINIPQDIIYVIYTSGSTGKPKGVINLHQGLTNRLLWMQEICQLTTEDRILQKTPFSFDVSFWEFFWPLINGAVLVIAEPEKHKNPQYLIQTIIEQKITIIHFVPSMLQQFLNQKNAFHCQTLKHVICSGESLPYNLQKQFFEIFPNIALHNLYGPTEAAIDVTAWKCQPKSTQKTVPIGKPISNIKTYILDDHLAKTPIGQTGELYIGGIGVAYGYLNRPDLTKEKFIKNPFNNDANDKLYKTGDLVRQLADGNLEYIGRIDDQIKIRGFRIELGEIEAVLNQHPLVLHAIVIAKEDSNKQKYLVGYLVCKKEFNNINIIRSFLAEQLPDYMIPNLFVQLDEIPLTLNGKADRKALLNAKDEDYLLPQSYIAPKSHLEKKLAAIWAKTLNLPIDSFGIHDNFFELGGHSLRAVSLVLQINEQFLKNFSMEDIFNYPTIAEFAKQLPNQTQKALSPIPLKDNFSNPIPLSSAQKQIWHHQQMSPEMPLFNEFAVIAIPHSLDIKTLESSLNECVKRHEIWRSRFQKNGSEVSQWFSPYEPFSLPTIDISYLPKDQYEQKTDEIAKREFKKPFNLTKQSPVRFLLIIFDNHFHKLYVFAHHIVIDAVTLFNLFFEELEKNYQCLSTGKPIPSPTAEIQYGDYVLWEKEKNQGGDTASTTHWQNKLAELPILQIPSVYPCKNAFDFHGTRINFTFSKELSSAVKKLAKQNQTTDFLVLLTAFNILLYRYTSQTDIPVGSAVSNRDHPQTKKLFGNFLNTIILRNDLSGNPDFISLLERVQKSFLGDYAHRFLSFQTVSEMVSKQKHRKKYPPIQAAFILEPGQSQSELDWQMNQLDIHPDTAKFHLTFELDEKDGAFFGRVEYNTHLFDADYITRMIGHFQTLLEDITANPLLPINQFNLLTQNEKQTVSIQKYNVLETVHEAFEKQVRKTPSNVAAQYENTQLTYTELNNKANQLARYLRKKGITAETPVAVYLERGFDMLISLLGIMKAGGVYIPIDPKYPEARLQHILEDSGAKILLTQTCLKNKLGSQSTQTETICIDNDRTAIEREDSSNVAHITKPDNLIYVIYTSGSTGKPKGVMVEHRNVIRLFKATEKHFQFSQSDIWTLFHSSAFDFSVWEMYGALLHGGKVIIIPYEISRSPKEFGQLILKEKVTILNQTPAAFRQLIADKDFTSSQSDLRYIIFGGEALDFNMLPSWYEHHEDDKPQLVNMYGITETTVHVTYFPITKQNINQTSTIGKPISDLSAYILDENLNQLPVLIPGELYVGGAGVARGYLGRPQLTDERFIQSPFSNEKLYKTGDLVKRLPDGNLEYLGRLDNQVKIRGFRIELGEIEAKLAAHKCVKSCVIMARKDKESNDYLAAYLLMHEEEDRTCADIIALKKYLRQHFPDYMIPQTMTFLDEIPLTSNGKINYKSLPEPSHQTIYHNQYVAPKTCIEKSLAKIWCDILHTNRVGICDNFFDIGGHSILAAQLVAKINEKLESNLKVHDFYAASSIEELSQLIANDNTNCKKI